jgi:hypothetical protein
MALPDIVVCPMCGARVALGGYRCLSCGEEFRLSKAEIDDLILRLKHWVRVRTAICAAVVFPVVFAMTQPPFGMGGSDLISTALSFIPAALITGPVAALIGLLLATRAYLHLQRILAEDSGSTLSYQVGRRFRSMLLKR